MSLPANDEISRSGMLPCFYPPCYRDAIDDNDHNQGGDDDEDDDDDGRAGCCDETCTLPRQLILLRSAPSRADYEGCACAAPSPPPRSSPHPPLAVPDNCFFLKCVLMYSESTCHMVFKAQDRRRDLYCEGCSGSKLSHFTGKLAGVFQRERRFIAAFRAEPTAVLLH